MSSSPTVVSAATTPAPAPAGPSFTGNRGIVKQVISGDTIVVRGRPVNGPPPERQLSLAHVVAPRLTRKDGADEPFAWGSREYLRKLLVGKEISFKVEYTSQSGRDYASIMLAGSDENIIPGVISAGWVKLQENKADKPELQDWKILEQTAQSKELGIWQKGDKVPDRIRDVKWTLDNPQALVDKNKGRPIKAIVERVRDGSTLQLLLLPSFQYIVVSMTGVKTPIYRKDIPDQPDLIEPFAAEAKFFTESRLLNQEVEVVLEGVNNKNLIGSILSPKGNIAEALLKEGFAKVADWSAILVSSGSKPLRDAEKEAKDRKIRLWKDYVPKDSEKEPKFSGKVVKILTGDSLLIAVPNGGERKITFASVRQPKPKDAKEGYYNLQAREYLRKKLIGKKVNVSVDYIKPAEGEFEEKTCATILLGEENVADDLISNGLAFVIKHKQDDPNRSPFYDQLRIAEEKAEKAKKGVHSSDPVPTLAVNDISENAAKAKQFFPRLNRIGKIDAVVEHVFSGSRLKVWAPKENFRATFLLSGVTCGRAGKDSSDPFANEALAFTSSSVLQHDVEIEIESMDKNGAFIGSLFTKSGANLSAQLLEQGLGYLNTSSADQSTSVNLYYSSETRAKAAKKNLWANYDANAAAKEKKTEDASDAPLETHEVLVTEVLADGQFYVQIIGPGVKELERLMREFAEFHKAAPAEPSQPKKGELCSAKFSADKQWYRARVTKVLANGQCEVLYIDYGNSETVPNSNLRILPSIFTSLPPQAILCSLAAVKAPKEDDYLFEFVDLVKHLAQGKTLLMSVLGRIEKVADVIIGAPGSTTLDETINVQVIRAGLGLVDKKKERRYQQLISALLEVQNEAKSQRLMIWRYGDITEEEEVKGSGPRRN